MKLLLLVLLLGCNNGQKKAEKLDQYAACVQVFHAYFCQIHGVGHWCDEGGCVRASDIPAEKGLR